MVVVTSPWPEVPLVESGVFDFVWSNPNRISDDAVAVIDGPTGEQLTRAQLKKRCQQFAWSFKHKLGLSPGDVLCLFSPNSIHYQALVLGMQCGGYVTSGANAAYTTDELAHQIGDSGSRVVMAHPTLLPVALSATEKLGWSKSQQQRYIVLAARKDEPAMKDAPAGFANLSDLMTENVLDPVKITKPRETVAYLGYSSGTSGKAKGVKTSHYNKTSVLSILKPFEIGQQDTQLAVLPLSHIYGLTKVAQWPILVGTRVVIQPKFELEPFCAYIEKYKVTVVMLVPPIALLLAREKIVSKYDLSSLRLIVCGAAPLGKELEAELKARLNCDVSQAYGLTESSPTTHFCPPARPKTGSIGPLLPMLRSRIVDPTTGKDLDYNKEGELWIAGPNIMMGYLNRPDANAETLVTDQDGTVWLRTGDVAYVDEDGYHYITDRLKELIKYKGHQVAPADLEATLLTCPYVADAAVIGLHIESMATELPRAYVVLSEEGKKQSNPSEAIRAWVDSKVANHKRLRGGVVVIDQVPKSPSGKILRRILRDRAKEELAKNPDLVKAKL